LYEEGEFVYKEGDPAMEMYFVVDGEVGFVLLKNE
jgi:CRP-like cAMP-binding protein